MRPTAPETVGPYELGVPLGRGGMGAVYRAYDPRLDRAVAIKRIHAGLGSERTRASERLRREARAVARLNHPAIVQVFDIVEVGGEVWVVMELVEGQTLAERLTAGPLAIDEALTLGVELAVGLAAAHRVDIVHRDLKSENVMIAPSGRAKILDFGLAKRLDLERSELSASQAVLGTCRSMSPEQARSRTIDARSDLFSLGVLLYEALSGVSPFRGETPYESLHRVVSHHPTPLGERRPEVPQELSRFVDRLLEKDPALRPESAAVVAQVLDDLRAPSFSPPRPAGGNEPTLDSCAPVEGPRRGSAGARRHRWPAWSAGRSGRLIGWGTLAILLAALFVLAAISSSRAPAPALLYVAVPEPIVSTGRGFEGVALIADGVRSALLRDLLARTGLSVLAPDQLDRGEGSPVEVGLALAADEVLSARLDCGARLCQVQLSRIATRDGALRWTERFEAPTDELHLAADLAASRLDRAFPGHPSRREIRPKVSPDAFAEYLELRREYYERAPDKPDDLADRLRSLRTRAKGFVEPYLLEANLARRRYYTTRDAALLDEALELAQQARAVDPQAVDPLVTLFAIALDGNRLELAEATFRDLERLEPGSATTLGLRARLLERRGEIAAALRLYREVTDARPRVDSLYGLANMEVRAGRLDEARATLERLLARAPRHLGGQSVLARLELLSGSAARAAELYRQLSERESRYSFVSNHGLALFLLGRFSAAAERFQAAVAMAPGNPAALLNLADARLLAGSRAEAQELYRSVLERTRATGASEEDWQNLTIRGQAHAHLGERTAAVAAVQEGLRLAPRNPQAAYEAALTYTLVGDVTSAMVNAERAVRLGLEKRWLCLPWFSPLATDPRFRALAGPAPSAPATRVSAVAQGR